MSIFFILSFSRPGPKLYMYSVILMKEGFMKKISLLSMLTLALIFLSNCSKEQITNSNLGSKVNAPNGTSGITTPGLDPLVQIDLKGRVESNDNNNNALAVDFDKTRGEFIVMIPMPAGFLFSPTGSFNNRPDITFSPIYEADGTRKFGVRIPVKYVLKGANFLPATKLPNGDPLPAMPAGYGELPSLALSFPQHNNTQITLYIGVNAIGLFITLPEKIAIPFSFQMPIKNSDKSKTFGYMTYVPAKGTYAPGLFLSTLIPPAMARILEDYFNL